MTLPRPTLDGVPAFPLQWPDGWPRTKRRVRSAFRLRRFGQIRDAVLNHLRLMHARQAVISSNLELRRDGLPYANQANPDDPGVALYWYEPGSKQSRSMACDRWDLAVDNLHAIGLSLAALRGIKRWGTTEIVDRAFAGFTALPSSPNEWRIVFGFSTVGPGPSIEEVRARYKKMAREAHPDLVGDLESMKRINAAWAAAQEELNA